MVGEKLLVQRVSHKQINTKANLEMEGVAITKKS